MPSRLHTDPTSPPTPRLRMKPPGPASGHVDGGWWPRSLDLADELPDLLTELAGRVGPVDRVSYNLTSWSTAPRRLTVDGRSLRLSGYHRQNAHILDLVNGRGSVTPLLVVPPDFTPDRAAASLSRASEPDGRGDVDELLDLHHPDATGTPSTATTSGGNR